MARNFRYFEKKRGNRRTGSRLLGIVGEAVFFAVLLVLGCAGIVAGIVWRIVPDWRVNHAYIEQTCKVVERRVADIPDGKGRLFRPEVKIEYEVPGAKCSIYAYDIHHTAMGTRAEAQAAIDQFAEGRSYPCWYDPADPTIAVIVRGYQWWIWPALLIPVSFVVIGIAGLIFTALRWGKSAERRAAVVRNAPATDLFALQGSAPDPQYPCIPACGEIMSSPGTRRAFRLPLSHSPGWSVFGLLVACVVWNGVVAVFLVMTVRSYLAGSTDRLMAIFIAPFLAVGVALIVVFARLVRHAAVVGPTLVEISDHPLLPGKMYRIFLSQSGNLKLQSIEVSLVCEEEAVFRQGTNVRTECREVFREKLHSAETCVIRPGEPLEVDCALPIPVAAMHSFRSLHNHVQWKLIVHGDVTGWQAFERSFSVIVRPHIDVLTAGGRTS